MRFVPFFVPSYNPKNLPTTPLFESILHKLPFTAIFLFGAVTNHHRNGGEYVSGAKAERY